MIKDLLLGNEVLGKREMMCVEILSHTRITKEDLTLVCGNSHCSSYGGIYQQRVRVYHDCRVRYPDGVEHEYKTFYAIQKSCPVCSDGVEKEEDT